jgi:hypothetical protein
MKLSNKITASRKVVFSELLGMISKRPANSKYLARKTAEAVNSRRMA